MNILILGGDGYLGWPTAMRFATEGHQVTVADNYLRRRLALDTDSEALFQTPNLEERARVFYEVYQKHIDVRICDLADFQSMEKLFSSGGFDAVIHYAEQPSGPYSMKGFDEARLTLQNNLNTTFNLIWCVLQHCPQCHIVKLGTMGEYGTPNIDIEEGYLDIQHNGREGRFLYPRQAGTLYHTTKVLDTDLLWFYVRLYNLRVTDLMQGPVYGISTPEMDADARLATHFFYDDIFGTVVNRFLVQAVAGIPLTVYGKGGQTRGYLNLRDTLACVELAVRTPPKPGELRILNQFTETFSVNELAERVRDAAQQMGIAVKIQQMDNPRKEPEEHYYKPAHSGLLEMGLSPIFMSREILVGMLELVQKHQAGIARHKVFPRILWK